MHLCDVTVFNSNSNLKQIQIQTKYNEFSCTETDVMLVVTFWPIGLCQCMCLTKTMIVVDRYEPKLIMHALCHFDLT